MTGMNSLTLVENGIEDLVRVAERLTQGQRKQLLADAHDLLSDSEPPDCTRCDSWKALQGEIENQRYRPAPEKWVMTKEGAEDETPRWIFRGQARASWPLQSSLDRMVSIDANDAKYGLLREFKAKAHQYGGGYQSSEGDEQWLASMQHHGAPTPLLDFTFSPYVAAYFALREPAPKRGYAMIYAIELGAVEREAVRVYSALPTAQKDALGLPKRSFELIEFALRDSWFDASMRSERGYVVPVQPKIEPLRMSHQQGSFLLNGAPDLQFGESLQKMLGASAKHNLRRIAIDRACRQDVLRHLYRMNIHELSLFPGLDGLAQFAKHKAELFCPRLDQE
jgi:hypothetical protein